MINWDVRWKNKTFWLADEFWKVVPLTAFEKDINDIYNNFKKHPKYGRYDSVYTYLYYNLNLKIVAGIYRLIKRIVQKVRKKFANKSFIFSSE